MITGQLAFSAMTADVHPVVRLTIKGEDYKAIFTENSRSIAMFDLYIEWCAGKAILCLSSCGITDVLELNAGDKITVKSTDMRTAYSDRIPHYLKGSTKNRGDYGSDQEYGNYREMTAGNLKDGKFYRSSSPMNKNGTCYIYCDNFLKDNNVECAVVQCAVVQHHGVRIILPDTYLALII